ncbi:MAG TPA: hypothetical protein VGI39_09175, partial [Polyangiaceae bacterium]
MSRLILVVPRGRHTSGRAVFLGGDGAPRLPPFAILATADRAAGARQGNPRCDPLRAFGDTPTGVYLVAGALPPRRGGLGALILAPAGGAALDALRAGRTRFLLHGGRLDLRGELRATFGGVRVSDTDLAALFAAINRAHAESDPLGSVEIVEQEDSSAGAAATPAPPRRRGRRDFVELALLTLAVAA